LNKVITLIFIGIITHNISYAEKDDDHSGHDHGSKERVKNKEEHKDEKHQHDDHKGEKAEEGEHKDHDDHGGGKSIGTGKAIEVVDEKKGFKLSKEAIKTLSIKLQTIASDEFLIGKKTLVVSKSKKGIYRFRGGFFKFLPVTSIKKVKGKYLVKVKGVGFGDQVVTDGVGLLQVTDVYSTDKSEYGHGH
jgi:hypothetical protein